MNFKFPSCSYWPDSEWRLIAVGRGEVTTNRRGFIDGVPTARGGLSACNNMTGKRRLRRWCYSWWREILHNETADGGSLSRRVGGWVAATIWKEGLYPPKRCCFDARKKKFNLTVRFVRFIGQTADLADLISIQLVFGLINQIGPEPWPIDGRIGRFSSVFKTMISTIVKNENLSKKKSH